MRGNWVSGMLHILTSDAEKKESHDQEAVKWPS